MTTCEQGDVCGWFLVGVYLITWLSLLLPNLLPLSRPAAAMVGAVFGITIKFAFNSPVEFEPDNLDVVAVLFSIMLVMNFVEETGFFQWLKDKMLAKYGWGVMIKISVISGFLSAWLLNDSIAIVVSPLVVDLASTLGVDHFPYLMALATACNIGSALAPSGNPQNALVLMYASEIPGTLNFSQFVLAMLVPSVVGMILNMIMLYVLYRKELNKPIEKKNQGNDQFGSTDKSLLSLLLPSQLGSIMQLSDDEDANRFPQPDGPGPIDEPKTGMKWDGFFSVLVLLTSMVMVVGFINSIDQKGISLGVGMLLMVYRGIKNGNSGYRTGPRHDDVTGEIFQKKIDIPLLILFIGQFILVPMVADTKLPDELFKWSLGTCFGESITEPRCVYTFSFMILVLSNILSNVPLMILMRPIINQKISDSGTRRKAWLIVAWAATVAGNFTMVGSAANLIVAAGAAKRGYYKFTSARHAVFGIPSTLIILFLGVAYLSVLF